MPEVPAAGLRRVTVPVFAKLPAPTRRAILHALGRYAPWEDGFDPTPPPLREGEEPGRPDFVGIGAQKAGTTWWYDVICAHPRVYVRDDIHKERHFFGRFATVPFGPHECARYEAWFPHPPGHMTGEWTPDYLHLPWVPPLLARAAPQVRLLVLVRDPVERFRSGLAHHRRDRGRLDVDTFGDAVNRGLYHAALGRWREHFAADQILVLQYESCVADPDRELARTLGFLGLEPFTHEAVATPVNATARSLELDEDVRRRLVELYEGDVRALAGSCPDLDLDLWPNFSDLA